MNKRRRISNRNLDFFADVKKNIFNSIGLTFRAKRVVPLLDLIDKCFQTHGCVRIIDIGGTEEYWNIVPKARLVDKRLKILIVNKFYPSPPLPIMGTLNS